MYSHMHTLSYFPPVSHQPSAPDLPSQPPSQQNSPDFRRSRSATDRFAFFKRAASAGPHQSADAEKMSAASSRLPANLSPRNAPDLNTLPDPRSPSPHPSAPGTPRTTQQHPDLSNEVATLSAKLINAINHQTNLDDALQDTRLELETAKARIVQLEREAKEHRDALSQGLLVRRTDSVQKEERLQNTINEERQKRSSAEREKKGMEQELENLTSQLFEEANKMVAAARKEREDANKRSEQLRSQLKDTEVLLSSQQDQLSELKSVLQEVQLTPTDIMTTAATAPSSPTSEKVSSKTFDYPTHQRNAHSAQGLMPLESPLHFAHLIHPIVRVDHQAFEDFVNLLRTTRGGQSRVSSGSYVGLNVLGLGSKDMSSSQSSVISNDQSGPANSSSRSTSAQNTPTIGTHSPNLSTDSSTGQSASLKDSRYYKRALVEDIEPTLRLDTAPALSWLARRTVISAITVGKLIIEPYPSRHAFHSPAYACGLCGEIRTSEEHLRRYKFRTSDSDDVTRYPLCDYCLSRVRTTCDFTTFLREARKGHMRNETAQDCRTAWEECIRLRERMFWSRIGGGVVPTLFAEATPRLDSPRKSRESERESNATQASRSDSDMQSVHRADSGLSTSSEHSPLSEVTTREEIPGVESVEDESEKPAVPTKDDPSPTTEAKPAELVPSPLREGHPLAQVTSASDMKDEVFTPLPAQAGALEARLMQSPPKTDEPVETVEAELEPQPAAATTQNPPADQPQLQSDRPTRPISASPTPTPQSTDAVTSVPRSAPSRPVSLLSPHAIPALSASSTGPASSASNTTAPTTDPSKPALAPLRTSKVASLASKFTGLDTATSPTATSPRSTSRPVSSHSSIGHLRGESVSPARSGHGSRGVSPAREWDHQEKKVPGSFA